MGGLVVLLILGVLALIFLKAVVSLAVSLVGLAVMILIWMFIGYLAGKIVRGKGYGPLYDAMLGLAGGVVGGIVLGLLDVNLGGMIIGPVITGTVGAVILIYALRMFGKEDFAK